MTLEMIEDANERSYVLTFTKAELGIRLSDQAIRNIDIYMASTKISNRLMGLSYLAKDLEDQTLAMSGKEAHA